MIVSVLVISERLRSGLVLQLQPLPHLQLDPQLQLPLPQEDIFFQIEGFEYISLGIEFKAITPAS
jgi:hypothetical protein